MGEGAKAVTTVYVALSPVFSLAFTIREGDAQAALTVESPFC